MAGTKFRGEMEERVKNILKYLTEHKEYIIFIDEIHIILSQNTNMDIANIR